MKFNLPKQRGFTLTEMAIVVVLGGILLAAGLMAGRGQISRAQTQDVLQIIGDLQTASASFQQRYGYLPGDWVYTANVFAGVTSSEGNGNGVITGNPGNNGKVGVNNEVGQVFLHLYKAGLIGKMGTDPQAPVQTQFGPVQVGSNDKNVHGSAAYVAANPSVKNVILLYGLPCEVVLEVDRSLDDGNTVGGRAQSSVECTATLGTAPVYIVPL